MRIIKSIKDMQKYSRSQKREGKKVAFVPTLGALHHGHLSLLDIARKKADILVVSIFLNPTQFGPNEDLDKYPQDLERDRILCEERKCNVLFLPSVEEMYPGGLVKDIKADPRLSDKLCGKSRPWHFDGVTTVVHRLFTAVEPDMAVFGKKDYQQSLVIRKMISDYKMPVKMVLGDIVRDPDGLAKSSRNRYLSEEERGQALCLSRSLNLAREMTGGGERDARKITGRIKEFIGTFPAARIDYVEIVHTQSLEPVSTLEKQALLALAVFIGETRLIDNTIIKI